MDNEIVSYSNEEILALVHTLGDNPSQQDDLLSGDNYLKSVVKMLKWGYYPLNEGTVNPPSNWLTAAMFINLGTIDASTRKSSYRFKIIDGVWNIQTINPTKSKDMTFSFSFTPSDDGESGRLDYNLEDSKKYISNILYQAKKQGFSEEKAAEYISKLIQLVAEGGVNAIKIAQLMLNCVDEIKIRTPQDAGHIGHNCRKHLYRKLKAVRTTREPYSPKGHHSPPAFEFGVRGHWRQYKNGKRIFIHPYTKCEGRGPRLTHEYKL